jgi:peroxiredoxin Q/BCP
MASAKRAKSKSKGRRVEAKQSKLPLKAKAPKAAKAASLAKQATKAIKRSVKSVADTAKKVATDAKKGVSRQAVAAVEQATLAKKSVAKKAKRVAKQAAAAKDSVAQQAKSVAQQAKATVVAKAGKAKQAARDRVGVVKDQLKQSSKSPAPDSGANGTVAVGSPAPSFSLPDQDGNVVTSESLKGAPYVLYFYPKDDTPGCTKEACGFRDSGPAFGKNGVRVLGVSPDSEKSHARFAEKYGLPFTLLADAEKKLAAAYGVWVEKTNYGRKYMGIERSTFLVDGKGRVQKIWRGVRVPGHVEDVLLASGTI